MCSATRNGCRSMCAPRIGICGGNEGVARHCEEPKATKQSPPRPHAQVKRDCFASLAMTRAAYRYLRGNEGPSLRGAEGDEAISAAPACASETGLLRFARNDVQPAAL